MKEKKKNLLSRSPIFSTLLKLMTSFSVHILFVLSATSDIVEHFLPCIIHNPLMVSLFISCPLMSILNTLYRMSLLNLLYTALLKILSVSQFKVTAKILPSIHNTLPNTHSSPPLIIWLTILVSSLLFCLPSLCSNHPQCIIYMALNHTSFLAVVWILQVCSHLMAFVLRVLSVWKALSSDI